MSTRREGGCGPIDGDREGYRLVRLGVRLDRDARRFDPFIVLLSSLSTLVFDPNRPEVDLAILIGVSSPRELFVRGPEVPDLVSS